MTELKNNSNSEIVLDPRLKTAASFVRPNSVVCDVGTDHAYIPIYLLLNGIAPTAVATDINKGPLERAKYNAERYGVSERIRFVLANGLCGVEPEREPVDDIVICGMGGELIARIIDASDYTRRSGVRLILQPMTCAPELREYLAGAGFNIITERLCRAAGKLYTCIVAEYDGIIRSFSEASLILGERNIENRDPLFAEYTASAVYRLNRQIEGLRVGGHDTTEIQRLLADVRRLSGYDDCKEKAENNGDEI